MAAKSAPKRTLEAGFKHTEFPLLPSNTMVSKQSQITSFLKPYAGRSVYSSEHNCFRDGVRISTSVVDSSKISVTYHRRTAHSAENRKDEPDFETSILPEEDTFAKGLVKNAHNQDATEFTLAAADSQPTVVLETPRKEVYLEKKPGQKRVSGQYFLELGQPDFFLSTCTICGLKYSRGDDEDEKVHKSFHRKHLQGVQFKGWHNERIVNLFDGDDRIILVLNSDPSYHQHKVQEVVAIMEKEMGLTNEWLVHRFCKVYLFISSKKIIGCLVSEPIKYGYRAVPEKSLNSSKKKYCDIIDSTRNKISDDFEDESILITTSARPNASDTINQKRTDSENGAKRRKNSCTVMQFGNIKFERKAFENTSMSRDSSIGKKDQGGAIVCSDVPEPAVCGVRGIWVSWSERRKGIATKLLDTMRRTFSLGYVLEPGKCAFSQPTFDGKAFAANYCKNDSFLIYKSDISGI